MSPQLAPGLPDITGSTRDIIRTLLRSGPLPRAELARRLSLSPASLTKLTRPMLEIGLFQQVAPQGRATIGRPSQPLSVDTSWTYFVGIKLTGDTAFAVLTDLGGAIVEAHERALSGIAVDDVVTDIVALVNICGASAAIAGVGVSLAGSVLRGRGLVVASPFLGWSDAVLAARIEDIVGVPVIVENDLRALTCARHWFDRHLTSFALVTFGAGIGCGLVLDDRLIEGNLGASGLIDHLRVDDHGPPCAHGHRGCVSGYATTAAILQASHDESVTVPSGLGEVGARARLGDPVAATALRAAGHAIGVVIGTICNITGPGAVILSGEGIEVVDVMMESIERGIGAVMHPSLPQVVITVTPLSFTDWARGAAIVAIAHHLDLRSGVAA